MHPTTNTMQPPAPASAGAEGMTDIRDIKGLEPISGSVDWKRIMMWGGAGLLLAGLLGLLYWRRRNRGSKAPDLPVISPREQALAKLHALEPVHPEAGKAFYFGLSNLFRVYLQGRFNLAAPEMTTEELIPELSRLSLGTTWELDLKAFLHRSDPVKFAGRQPDGARMKEDLNLVRRFVLESSHEEEDV
jgi:hypothetical protein